MGKVAQMTNYGRGGKVCPRCEVPKDIDDFGYRQSRGKIIVQPWCKECRGLASVLGPAKRWRDLPETTIQEMVAAKRELFRKPKPEPKPKAVKAPKAVAPKPVFNPRELAKKAKAANTTVRGLMGLSTTPPASKNSATKSSTKAKPVFLSADLGSTKVLFAKHFPKDKQKRSWKTMIERLQGKLGDQCELTPTAKARLTGE